MTNNNCYNYANNVITTKVARPGRGGGKPLKEKPFTPADVKNAATLDGLIEVTESQLEGGPFTVPNYHLELSPGKRYFVALYVKNVQGIDPKYGNYLLGSKK